MTCSWKGRQWRKRIEDDALSSFSVRYLRPQPSLQCSEDNAETIRNFLQSIHYISIWLRYRFSFWKPIAYQSNTAILRFANLLRISIPSRDTLHRMPCIRIRSIPVSRLRLMDTRLAMVKDQVEPNAEVCYKKNATVPGKAHPPVTFPWASRYSPS